MIERSIDAYITNYTICVCPIIEHGVDKYIEVLNIHADCQAKVINWLLYRPSPSKHNKKKSAENKWNPIVRELCALRTNKLI